MIKPNYELLSENHEKDLRYLYNESTYLAFMALMAGDIKKWAEIKGDRIELSLSIHHKKYTINK